ncbi:MAG: glutathione S-transferase family protein [Thermoplasmatota archaeon]
MHLYGHLSSGNAYKPWLLLKLLGRDFDHTPTGFWEETRMPEFRALNPNGKVPVLVDDDFVLWESNAILCYLAEGTPWLPRADEAGGRTRAKVLQWLFFEQYSHEPFVATMRAAMHFQPVGPERDAFVEGKRKGAEHALGVMEGQLAATPWLAGDAPTVADLSLFAYTSTAEEGTLSLDGYPAIRAWLDRVRALPGFAPQPPFEDPRL